MVTENLTWGDRPRPSFESLLEQLRVEHYRQIQALESQVKPQPVTTLQDISQNGSFDPPWPPDLTALSDDWDNLEGIEFQKPKQGKLLIASGSAIACDPANAEMNFYKDLNGSSNNHMEELAIPDEEGKVASWSSSNHLQDIAVPDEEAHHLHVTKSSENRCKVEYEKASYIMSLDSPQRSPQPSRSRDSPEGAQKGPGTRQMGSYDMIRSSKEGDLKMQSGEFWVSECGKIVDFEEQAAASHKIIENGVPDPENKEEERTQKIEGKWHRFTRMLTRKAYCDAFYELRGCWLKAQEDAKQIEIMDRFASNLSFTSMSEVAGFKSGVSNGTLNQINHHSYSQSEKRDMMRKTRKGSKGEKRSIQCNIVFLPFSKERLCWELVTLMLVGYNMFLLPLQLFELNIIGPEPTGLVIGFAVFWTLDMAFSFVTGFVIDEIGTVEFRIIMIAKHYLRTKFALDLLLVVIDWVMVVVEAADAGGGAGRQVLGFLKVLRLLRLAQVVRILRFNKILQNIKNRLNSNQVCLYFGIIRIVFGLVLCIHVMGCLWYSIGKASDNSWVTQEALVLESTSYHYLTSVHWSMAQFHGAMEVVPVNSLERIFATVASLVAFFLSALLVAGMTNILVQIESLQQARTARERSLRQFLSDHTQLSMSLGMRLKKVLDFYAEKKRVKDQELDIFNLLPDRVLAELHVELRLPILIYHPFFSEYNMIFPKASVIFCHKGIHAISFMGGDTVFSASDLATHMFFVVEGLLDYRCALLPFMSKNTNRDTALHNRASEMSDEVYEAAEAKAREMVKIGSIGSVAGVNRVASDRSSGKALGKITSIGTGFGTGSAKLSMRGYRSNASSERSTTGAMWISRRPEDMDDEGFGPNAPHVSQVLPGQWVSEAVLWMHWIHCGELVVWDDCSLFSLKADLFEELVSEQPGAMQLCKKYAFTFAERMRVANGTDYNKEEFEAKQGRATYSQENNVMSWLVKGASKTSLWG